MLSVIEKVQTNTWGDPSNLLKATTQATAVVLIEKDLLEASKAQSRCTPKLESSYRDDVAFARLLDLYLPPEVKKRAEGELAGLADAAVSQQAMDWVADAEHCPPQVQHWDSWGYKKDELVTSQGWKNLWRFGISERYVTEHNLRLCPAKETNTANKG